jgi:hypothetical protein
MKLVSWMRSHIVTLIALVGLALAPTRLCATDAAEAREIAQEAYVFAYPAVLAELTRRQMVTRAPVNHWLHRPDFPNPNSLTAVRPNADTLYSALWYDVSQGPVIFTVPDSGKRYYLLTLQDMWTDIFATMGTRTTGTGPLRFAIAGPDWKGTLPAGVQLYRSPTPIGLIISRPQTNGAADIPAVRRFQAAMTAEPLEHHIVPTPPAPRPGAPARQVEELSPEAFFTTFGELMRVNPPHYNDQPILARIRRLGFVPGQPFNFTAAPRQTQDALRAAPQAALARIRAAVGRNGSRGNGWWIAATPFGSYGTSYMARAAVAYDLIFGNLPDDALYPSLDKGPDGKPLDSGRRYILHFDRDHLPPARAFWSVSMYDQRLFFTPNAINRYAIGDRDNLKFNPDGSLDIYIQRGAPGGERDRNWLPAPAAGNFTITLRLYWPEQRALDGNWSAPALEIADPGAART